MNHAPHRTRGSSPSRGRSGRVALLLALFSVVGCKNFQNTQPAEPAPNSSVLAADAVPNKYHHRVSQYVFYSDFPLNKNAPLFQELSELRDQVCKELQLPASNNVIQVYLFEDQERYERYMRAKYSELPVRRAFFIKQQRAGGGSDDLQVFTYWGNYIRQDLRHELTHGLLHSVLKDVPIWLDEGLAEVFELPADRNGVNVAHLEQLRRGPVQPDLQRLEHLNRVDQMQTPEYREAWAWVHMMLRGKPEHKAVLLSYLHQLRGPKAPGSLAVKLKEVQPSLNQALATHLAEITVPPTVARGSSR